MQFLADLIISGLAAGAIYGLFGMAYAAIYKATGVVNFAQGEVAMLIVYLTAAVLQRIPLPFAAAPPLFLTALRVAMISLIPIK